MSAVDVVGVGVPCVDTLLRVERLPQPNEGWPILEYSRQGGGKVPTALVAAARLGVSAAIIGAVGDDAAGDFCVEDFSYNGVETRGLARVPGGETDFAVILSDDATQGRSIMYHRGTCRQDSLDEGLRELVASARCLHLSDVTPASLKALGWAKRAGVLVMYDADAFDQAFREVLPDIDLLVASEYFYRQAAHGGESHEALCRRMLAGGAKVAVITLGARGCVGMDGDGYFEEGPFQTAVKDTTGAGDVFHGAFLCGWLKGWRARACARFSNAVAGVKCQSLGGRAGIPTLEQVAELMQTGAMRPGDIPARVAHYRRAVV